MLPINFIQYHSTSLDCSWSQWVYMIKYQIEFSFSTLNFFFYLSILLYVGRPHPLSLGLYRLLMLLIILAECPYSLVNFTCYILTLSNIARSTRFFLGSMGIIVLLPINFQRISPLLINFIQ